jgi:hypothetical protein
MTKTIIIIILLIIIYILYTSNEHFSYFNTVDENTPKSYSEIDRFFRILFSSDKNTSSIYENRFNFIPATIDDKTKLNNDVSLTTNFYDDIKSNKCCLVKKELDGNNFIYKYKKYNDL